ncbi:MAG: AtpZ/AtpI family protein [bacterium]|nr:AtpZ/AtpI family protein [bacterium]
MQSRKDVMAFAWGLGYRLALPIVFFALGGRLVDKKFDTAPIFLLIGIFSAMALSFFLIWRLVKQIET